jgi:aminopeptidase N
MVRNLERYKRFEPRRRALMRAALERVAAAPGLSRETAEVVGKALA